MSTSAVAVKLAADDASFTDEVLARSEERPVVVDFWASWCGPCRQLGPVLEAEIEALGGTILLRTVDVDQNPGLAQRYGVRGIPAVKAFKGGQPVAEFVGAQPATAVRSFIAGLLPSEADRLVEQGDEAALRQALELDSSHLPARRALARILLARSAWAQARSVAEQAPQDRECDGLAAWAELAEDSEPQSSHGPLLRALADSDFEAAAERAVTDLKVSSGESRDRLRRVAIYCFEALGQDHPAAVAGRSELAAALY